MSSPPATSHSNPEYLAVAHLPPMTGRFTQSPPSALSPPEISCANLEQALSHLPPMPEGSVPVQSPSSGGDQLPYHLPFHFKGIHLTGGMGGRKGGLILQRAKRGDKNRCTNASDCIHHIFPPRQLGYLDFTCGCPSSPSPFFSPPSSSSPLHSTPLHHTTPRSTPHHTTPHLAHIASHMASQPDATSSVDLVQISEISQIPGKLPF